MSAPVFQMDFIQDIKRPITIQHCGNLVFTGDNLSDTVSVSVLEDGQPYAISGTVTMNCIRADGATVTVTGSVSGNTASATLTQACVAVPGPLAVVMKVTSDTTTTTLLKAVYMVDVGVTGTAVDPGTIIPDVTTLINAIETAVGTIPSDYSSLLATIAPNFASGTYSAGQYVWNNGTLYKFTDDHSGSWTGTDVEAVVIGDELTGLKSALEDTTGNFIIEMSESGRYINLSGATANVNNPSTTSNHVRYGTVRCTQGDMFTVSASGGYGSRAYGFVAQDGTVLRVAPELYTCDNLLLTAPANSYYFIVNDQSTPWKLSYIGKLLNNRVSEAQIEVENNKLIKNGSIKATFVPSGVVWVNKTIDANGNLSQNTDSTRAITQNLIDVSGYNRIEWNASAIGLTDASVVMYDGLGGYIESKYVAKSPYEIPNANVAKIRVMFGGSSAIDTSKLGDDIVIVKSDSVRDNIELIPLNVGTKKTIMLIGDSITQGYGSTGFVIYNTVIDGVTYSVRGNGPNYPDAGPDYQVGTYLYTTDTRIWYEALSGSGWAQKLKEYYEEKFNCTVLNYGMSGIDSSDVSAFRSNLIINSNADIVIMMIGTNDRGNTPLDTFYNRIYKTGRLIIQSGKKLILMAPIPASVSNESAFSRHIEDYEHVLYKIAKLLNCKFISMYEQFMDYCDLRGITIDSLLGDGLHPNDEGYEVMFKLITKELGLNRKRPDATW